MKTQKIDEEINENQKTKSNESEDCNAISSIDEQLNLFAEIIIDLIIIEQNEKKQATN